MKSIASLRRGVEVLESIRGSTGLTLHALHRSTSLPKASLLRILKTLEEAGVIQRRIADGAYMPRTVERSPDEPSRAHLRLIELAAPSLRALHAELPWPSDVGVRDGTRMLVLESNRPLCGLAVNRKVVGFHPHMLLSALGRAYLAFCPSGEREALLGELARTTDAADRALARRREWIEQLVAQTRQQGYGVRDPRHLGPDADAAERFSAMAVPIMVDAGVAACLSCVWLAAVATEADIASRYLELLRRTADEIGKRLGA